MKDEKKEKRPESPVIHQTNSNCQVFNGPISGCVFAMPGSNVTQNAGAGVPAGREENSEVPECLTTPEAEELWTRLREAGFVAEGSYALAQGVSSNQATYIADRMAARLGIGHKWKPFQKLWGIRNMAQLAGAWKETGKLPPRAKEIDALI